MLARTVINNIIDGYSLTDIWRDMHPDIKQFTWHSHHKYFVGLIIF